ncbi:MAG: STAS domain-containing protein [candidate division KSB1 bacterium]|nr:STAS domain-containing protein [candidate division KSB1 bacterium]
MTIKEEKRDGIAVLTVKGKMMGGPETAALHQKVKDLIAEGVKKVVIDLSGVKWLNSSGLGVLMGAMTSLRNAGGDLKLSGVTDKVQSLFMITKLITIFDTYDTPEEAVAAFQS